MAEIVSASAALAIITNCPFPLIILDRDGRVTGYSHAFEGLLGSTQAAALLRLDPQALADHPDRALLVSARFVRWTDRDNVPRRFEIHRCVISEPDFSEVRFFVDVTKQVELQSTCIRLENELEQNILTDTVTGLLNSRGILLALEPQVARSRRYNSPISVIMLAVDGGSDDKETLLTLARFLKDQLRWADLVACNEQREFVLVLPETTAESAHTLADKLKRQVHELVTRSNVPQQYAPCCGVAAWHRSDSAITLLRRAAAALTRARASRDESEQFVAL
ncbi:MAG: diguanylate cyclase [Thiogranum sp.]|nr:diguanylate cyclase [Thiogranum sp.]